MEHPIPRSFCMSPWMKERKNLLGLKLGFGKLEIVVKGFLDTIFARIGWHILLIWDYYWDKSYKNSRYNVIRVTIT
jgi:hypothetical protein